MEFVKINFTCNNSLEAGIPSLVTSEDPFVQSFSSISFMHKQNIASRKETSYKTKGMPELKHDRPQYQKTKTTLQKQN